MAVSYRNNIDNLCSLSIRLEICTQKIIDNLKTEPFIIQNHIIVSFIMSQRWHTGC